MVLRPLLSLENKIINNPLRRVIYCLFHCGNAVPLPFAEALVRANLPELCVRREAA